MPPTEPRALQKDEGKLRVDLVPPSAIQAMAAVFGFGEGKYPADPNLEGHLADWQLGMPWMKHYGSIIRHLMAWRSGEDIDPESGLPHLYHVITRAAMLNETVQHYPALDNRPKY